MIHTLKLTVLSCWLVACSILSATAQGKVNLSGQIKNPKGEKVYLRILRGGSEGQKIDSARLDTKGNFAMSFAWSAPGEAFFQHGDEQTSLYLIPGDILTLTLDTEQFDETLKYTGKGAKVNNYLAKKILYEDKGQRQRALAAKMKEASYVKFADSTLAADQAFLTNYFKKQKLSPAEAAFVEKQKTDMLYRWAMDRTNYPGMHSYYNKLSDNFEPSAQYYDYLKKVKVDNQQAIDSEEYQYFTQAYIRSRAGQKFKQKKAENPNYTALLLEALDEEFSPGKVRVMLFKEVVENNIKDTKDFEAVDALLPKYRAEAARFPELLAEIETIYSNKQKLRTGNSAPDFFATTADGRKISLSDYKGKVVYVDLWASWCGPCLAEIPHAKKLMEEFKDKEVVFLNVSLDQSDKAWRDALEKHGVHGINALADGAFSAPVAKAYQVNGIPQYLLISRDGTIVSSNAHRPSGKAKEQIEAALAAAHRGAGK